MDITSAATRAKLDEMLSWEPPRDVQPVYQASLSDLDLARFRYYHCPDSFDADVAGGKGPHIGASGHREAGCECVRSGADGARHPDALPETGVFLPGAYVQFLRFAGEDRSDPIEDAERFDAPLADIIHGLDATLRAHCRTSVEIGTRTTEIRRHTYALATLRELVRNAIMHRAYEGTHAPIHVSWYSDRIEIVSPGGFFGDVSVENVGESDVVAYRNANLAEAMRAVRLSRCDGGGIARAGQALRANDQPVPSFEADEGHVRCTVHMRRDWRARR